MGTNTERYFFNFPRKNQSIQGRNGTPLRNLLTRGEC